MDILWIYRMKVEGRKYFFIYFLDIFLWLKEFENAEDAQNAKDDLDGLVFFVVCQLRFNRYTHNE